MSWAVMPMHITGDGQLKCEPQRTTSGRVPCGLDLYWCNIGNTPNFRVARRSEVIDITLADPSTLNMVTNWQVSENPSLSDHALITFTIYLKIVGGRWIKSNKVDWDLYRRTLAALLPSSEGTINSVDDLNSLESLTTRVMELAYDDACPRKWVSFKCQSSIWWTPELTLLQRQVYL